MLHELLLALVGFTGDFVIDERERREVLGLRGPPIPDGAPTFRLASDLSFLQPSERSAIQKLIPLGFYYRELDHFVKDSYNLIPSNAKSCLRNPESSEGKPRSPSIYRRAVGNGIVEILSIYRAAVLQVEQKLLSEPEPILTTVTQGLNKFHVILPPLHDLVMEIARDDVRGGKLLNLLHKQCHCGVPELQLCIQRLLWHGHQVMYNQLASWMVYGILQDQYGEFFIRKEENGDQETTATCSDNFGKLLRTSDDTSLTNWQYGYHIFLDMLPDYIHMRVAESILFAGKAIKVLQNPSPSLKNQVAMLQQSMLKGSYGELGFPNPQIDSIDGLIFPGDELLPQSEADKIDSVFQELKKASEFHKKSFEHAVDFIRAIAANHLWQLVVVCADLNGHLRALKDYFLLAKGDFFQCFLEESRQLMRLPPRQSTAEADLKIPFQLAALKTVGDDDKHFSRVSLRISSFGSNASSQIDLSNLNVKFGNCADYSVDGWDGIALDYAVIWPLQLFLTQEVLSKYCRVFQYLLRLKRTQMELEKSWASVMHQEHLEFAKNRNDQRDFKASHSSRRRSTTWRIREHMVFLIRNLQFYIQVDVIESQWNILQNHLQESRDFTELVVFHHEYLSALISQSFLDIGSVSRILDSIMKLCLLFCWITENADMTSNSSELLDNIIEEFNRKSNSLYTILRSSRLAGSQRAPYLRRFLLRLNFNSFFESAARGVLNIGRVRPSIYPSSSTDDHKT